MSSQSRKWLVLAAALFLVCNTACYSYKTSRQYKLTIYVDEGHGSINGHVFVSLNDGSQTMFRGFYAKNKSLALAGKGGGEVRDDSKLAEKGWDVKREYIITSDGYKDALQAIVDWQESGVPWSPNHHCGDFSETVAKAAGIGLDLPRYKTGYNRPELFGLYLRENGGSLRTPDQFQLPEKKPAVAPQDAVCPDLNGRWLSNDYVEGEETVIVHHYGKIVSAVKTKGNSYVKAGEITWQGSYLWHMFKGQIVVGYVDKNNQNTGKRELLDIFITVIDNDHFEVSWGDGKIKTFRRVRY